MDSSLHLDEGSARLSNFLGARRTKVNRLLPHTKLLCSVGQPTDRADLQLHDEKGCDEKDNRDSNKIVEEQMRGAAKEPTARDFNYQNTFTSQNCYLGPVILRIDTNDIGLVQPFL